MPQLHFARRTIPSIAIGALILLVSGLVGPGLSAQAQASGQDSLSPNARVYHTRFKPESDKQIREVAIEGAIRFSPDETKIEWIGDGAYLRIVTLEKSQKLSFDAKADGQGRPTIRYEVDGNARPYDKSAARYLADILPVIFRELGHNELDRVQATYDQDGAAGVIRLITKIRSDYSTGLHTSAFLGLKGLSDLEINDSFSILGHHINSDYELAAFLYRTSDLYRERPGVRHSYLSCLNQFESEIERSRAIKNLFGLESLNGDEMPTMTRPDGC